LRFFQLGGGMPDRGFEVQLRLLCDLAGAFRPFERSIDYAFSLDRDGIQELAYRPRKANEPRHSLYELNSMRPNFGCLVVHNLARLQLKDHEMLRGLSPEIYPLIRAAARKCSIKLLVEFSETMCGNTYWPTELGGALLTDHLSEEREKWTSIFIEVTDRLGRLQSLVDLLIERGRGTRPLLQVVRDYDSRLRELFNPG